MWLLGKKRNLGIKEETSDGVIETIKLYYLDEKDNLKHSCIGDIVIPHKFNKRLSNMLKERDIIGLNSVEQSDKKYLDHLLLKREDVLYICLNSILRNPKTTYSARFIIGGYGVGFQVNEELIGEVFLIKSGGIEKKLKDEIIIPVTNLLIPKKHELYPVGILFKKHIFEAELK